MAPNGHVHSNSKLDTACPSLLELTATSGNRGVAGLLPPRSGFDPGPVHIRFVIDKLAMEQTFQLVLRFYQYHSTNTPYSSSSEYEYC